MPGGRERLAGESGEQRPVGIVELCPPVADRASAEQLPVARATEAREVGRLGDAVDERVVEWQATEREQLGDGAARIVLRRFELQDVPTSGSFPPPTNCHAQTP